MGYQFNVADGPTIDELRELQQPHAVKLLAFTLKVAKGTIRVGVVATEAALLPDQSDWWTVSGQVNSVVKDGAGWSHPSPSPGEGFIANYSPLSPDRDLSTFSIREQASL